MYYFVSDIHLGLSPHETSAARERLFIRWLDEVARDADAIFIVGDMFDFWYEYRRVVPKGFTRLLGTLSKLTDSGVEIHFFPGNHDMWAYDYLHAECGVTIHHTPATPSLYGRRFFITHGDDITARARGPMTRFMNACFRSRPARWLFSHLLHPDLAMRIGQGWSSGSRKSKAVSHRFLGEADPLVSFAHRYAATHPTDYFVFGHNHCAEVYPLNGQSTAVFLGEWIERPHYAALAPDGSITLRPYPAR